VHLGRPEAAPGSAVNPPVALSATYRQDGPLVYGRDGSPTWTAFEAAIGGLEGGQALSFASGSAAIAALIETLPVPGRVVIAGDAYNGTRKLLADVASRGRLRYRTVDVADTDATLAACAEMAEGPGRPSGRTGDFGAGGLLWLESPTNPLLAIADIAALVAGAHELGLDVVVDNTFATPILQRPLELGVDVVVHSATKAIGGHSDILLGVAVTRRAEVLELLRTRRSLHGATPGAFEAWLGLRGVRTLPLRVRHSQRSAGELARRLCEHPGVLVVRYPGLPDDPGHARAEAQMDGPGFIVSFDVRGGADEAEKVALGTRVATPATSLGGVETLIERRHRWAGEEALPPSLLRLSVGIEDVEDLWADLDLAITLATR
jgi:cystathionine gamma-synthase